MKVHCAITFAESLWAVSASLTFNLECNENTFVLHIVLFLLQYVECFCGNFSKHWQNLITNVVLQTSFLISTKMLRTTIHWHELLGKTLHRGHISPAPHTILCHSKIVHIFFIPGEGNQHDIQFFLILLVKYENVPWSMCISKGALHFIVHLFYYYWKFTHRLFMYIFIY